jgi:hypothetical protein
MAFELILATGTISNEGGVLAVTDKSDWAQSIFGARTSYGIYLKARYYITSTPNNVGYDVNIPQTNVTWNVYMSRGDGRYSFTALVFPTIESYAGAEVNGDLGYYADPQGGAQNQLRQYDGANWDTQVSELDHEGSAVYTDILEVPYLALSYTQKNIMNLAYIKQVKNDIDRGVDQNKMYYKRTDLDYFNALLDGAGYNFALALYSNYYAIVENLNDITANQQIS